MAEVESADEIEQLKERIQKLEEDNRRWMRLAGASRLTGLPNGLMLYQVVLPRELSKAIEEPTFLACALICPDGIGEVNQEHGRAVGDELIKQIGNLLKGQMEPGEQLYHCDGANFAVLLSGTSEGRARRRATMLISDIRRERWTLGDVTLRSLTCSAGVAEFEGQVEKARIVETVGRLYEEMSDRLYQAKERGGGYVTGVPRQGG